MIAPPPTTPAYMFGAWLDCLRWAIAEPEILERYRRETGSTWRPASTPIDRAIDEATGRGKLEVEKFVAWFNVQIWGAC